jgi:hypothetical protein
MKDEDPIKLRVVNNENESQERVGSSEAVISCLETALEEAKLGNWSEVSVVMSRSQHGYITMLSMDDQIGSTFNLLAAMTMAQEYLKAEITDHAWRESP